MAVPRPSIRRLFEKRSRKKAVPLAVPALAPLKSRDPLALFGDLRVRPKLMVLHNLFFVVLSIAVYFSLIPQYKKQVDGARERELFPACDIAGVTENRIPFWSIKAIIRLTVPGK